MSLLESITTVFSPADDAISLLKADHRTVDGLFKEFEDARQSTQKIRIASAICWELTVHATIEEEILYPRALAALKEDDADMLWEATVEHGTLKGLIDALGGMRADDPSFDAHVKVLQEYVTHHVREEENEMLPKLRASGLDLQAIGEELKARKDALNRESRAATRKAA